MNFTSLMFNAIDRGLLCQKAEATVQEAVAVIGWGQKTVTAVASTMGLDWKLDTLAIQPWSAIANNDLLGALSLNNLNLNQFSFTSIPGLSQVAIANFKGWEGTPIEVFQRWTKYRS